MADENEGTVSSPKAKSPKKVVASPKQQENSPVPNGNSHTPSPEKPRKRKELAKGGEGKSKENKGKRRKRMRDASAPKHPISGYMRFLTENRERIKSENPRATFAIITKTLAAEWSKLGSPERQQYLDAAEHDKERYAKEMEAYKQTEAYKLYTKKQRENKLAKSSQSKIAHDPAPPTTKEIKETPKATKHPDVMGLDIPIFTEDFLDHNKTRELELRQLRKSCTDYEQQNAILQTHLSNMQTAVDKLEVEVMQQMTNNAALKQHLDQLRHTLVTSFCHLPLPGSQEPPSMQTIDGFMMALSQYMNSDHPESKAFVASAKTSLNALQFHG